MSHGGGGGGFGHGGGMHHGGHHGGHSLHHGGEPDMSASWNMAYVGEKRSGRLANLNPFPIVLGLIVFAFMILPFVMDWDEPHLQRLLMGHDMTPKEIAHRQAIDQMLAGAMRSKTKQAFGDDIGGMMIQDPGPQSGADLIAEPQGEAPDLAAPPAGGGLSSGTSTADGMGGSGGFMVSADSPPQAAAPAYAPQAYPSQSYSAPSYGQSSFGGFASPMTPSQPYVPTYPQSQPYAPPASGFSNQRFISPPSARAAAPGRVAASGSGIDYHAPRHRVVVER